MTSVQDRIGLLAFGWDLSILPLSSHKLPIFYVEQAAEVLGRGHSTLSVVGDRSHRALSTLQRSQGACALHSPRSLVFHGDVLRLGYSSSLVLDLHFTLQGHLQDTLDVDAVCLGLLDLVHDSLGLLQLVSRGRGMVLRRNILGGLVVVHEGVEQGHELVVLVPGGALVRGLASVPCSHILLPLRQIRATAFSAGLGLLVSRAPSDRTLGAV